MMFYWLLLFVVTLKLSIVLGDAKYRRVTRQTGTSSQSDTCTTPDSQIGTCINIRKCESLLDLLVSTRGRDPTAASFLRRSQCGVENRNPKVCCIIPPLTNRISTDENTTKGSIINRISATTNNPAKNTIPKNNSQCGKSTWRSTAIVASKENADIGNWPWMAALSFYNSASEQTQFKCGAALISNQWLVTAAHCVSNTGNLVLKSARIGDLNLYDGGEDKAVPLDVPIDQVFLHPDYANTSPITNDIALIRLSNPVNFTLSISPICILSEPEHRMEGFYSRKLPFLAGWGTSEQRAKPTTSILQKSQVPVVDNKDCAKSYENLTLFALIDQRVLCIKNEGENTCQGDSGGPLIIPVGNTFYLAGVASYGLSCGDSIYPAVYTKVAHFAEWIRSTAKL